MGIFDTGIACMAAWYVRGGGERMAACCMPTCSEK